MDVLQLIENGLESGLQVGQRSMEVFDPRGHIVGNALFVGHGGQPVGASLNEHKNKTF